MIHHCIIGFDLSGTATHISGSYEKSTQSLFPMNRSLHTWLVIAGALRVVGAVRMLDVV